jgi:hypothetical protein
VIGGALRLLIRGPGAPRWRWVRWAVTVAALAGAAMLTWSAVIHLELWVDGYRDIPTIGPLFLAGGVVDIVLAVAVIAVRWIIALLAGAIALLATAGGLLVSAHGGLFGYTESLAVPYATLSLDVEFAGAGVLLAGALALAVVPSRTGERHRPGSRGNPSHAASRT